MNAGPEEGVIRAQLARFGSACRIYAPLYRQVTLTALRSAIAGRAMAADRVVGYNDVKDAWNYYLEHNDKPGTRRRSDRPFSGLRRTDNMRNEMMGSRYRIDLFLHCCSVPTSLSRKERMLAEHSRTFRCAALHRKPDA